MEAHTPHGSRYGWLVVAGLDSMAMPSEVAMTPEERLLHLSRHQLDAINKIIELLEAQGSNSGGPHESSRAYQNTNEAAEALLRPHWDPYALPDPQKPRAVANSLDLVASQGRTDMRLEIEGEPSQLISVPFGNRAKPYKMELLGHIVKDIPETTCYWYIPLADKRWFEVTLAQPIAIDEQDRECIVLPVPQPLVNEKEEDPQLRYHRDRAALLTWLKHAPTQGGRHRLEDSEPEKLALARSFLDRKAKEPRLSYRKGAVWLKMPDYEKCEEDSVLEAREEKAAEERLRGYITRLREVESKK
jgi:hypothetical protein